MHTELVEAKHSCIILYLGIYALEQLQIKVV